MAHAEASAGGAGSEAPPAGGAIQDGVADDGVLVRCEASHVGRHEHDLATAHALAQVVVGFALEHEAHPIGREGAERLARAAHETRLEKWQGADTARLFMPWPQASRADLAGNTRANRSVAIANQARRLEA